MVEITEGCHVRVRSGEEYGPVKRDIDTDYCWCVPGMQWTEDGKFLQGIVSAGDIVEVIRKPVESSLGLPPFTPPPMPAVKPARVADVKPRRIYLSGPMTGLPEFNYPAFHRAAAALRSLGVEVYNPAEYPAPDTNNFPLREAFTDYARYILNEADALFILPGWENSKGVKAEKALAEVVGLQIEYL